MDFGRCLNCMQPSHEVPCPHCGFDPAAEPQESFEMPLGSILHGRYLIGRRLGQGGFGITYVGWDLLLNAKVAVKEYFPAGQVTRHPSTGTALLWNNGEAAEEMRHTGMEAFLKEARRMMKVDELVPIVRVLNTFQENETAYIVMEFVEGETLKQRVERDGPIAWDQARELFFPVLETMAQMHSIGLIHRDISPDNLMLQPQGGIRILDLGASKDLNTGNGMSSMLVTKSGFSPLEQYAQRGSSGSWTDVYALASTIYFSLTGVTPPTAVDRLANDNVDWKLPQLKQLPGNVLSALQDAMIINAKQRTQTMTDLLEAMKNPKYKRRKQGKDDSLLAPAARKSTRPGWILPAAAGALVLAAAAGFLLMPKPAPQPEPTAAVVEETQPSLGPVYFADRLLDQDSALGTGYARPEIASVSFRQDLSGAPEGAVDLSAPGDGSILAWAEPQGDKYALTVGSAGDMIAPADCSRLFADFTNLESVDFGGCLSTAETESFREMFSSCGQLKQVDLIGLDAARVKDLSGMFENCAALTQLSLEGLAAAAPSDMHDMFAGCAGLTKLDLSGLRTDEVTDLHGLFRGCANLEEAVLTGINTAAVTDMQDLFSGCVRLSAPDLSGLDTAAVTDMSAMFENCSGLTALDVSGLDTAKVTRMDRMFLGARTEALSGAGGLNIYQVTSHENFMDAGALIDGKPWENLFRKRLTLRPDDGAGTDTVFGTGCPRSKVVSVTFLDTLSGAPDNAVDVSLAGDGSVLAWVADHAWSADLYLAAEGGVPLPEDSSGLFQMYTSLTKFDASGADTSLVRSMARMFNGCTNLAVLDLTPFDTASVTDMSGMFSYCANLRSVDLSSFDTANVTNMSAMFSNCSSRMLGSLDVSGFNTANVTDMSSMFLNCITPIDLDPSGWDTGKVTNMEKMFMNCAGMVTFRVEHFDTANVTNMSGMFFGCTRLVNLDLSGYNTSKVTNMSNMFSNCTNLAKLNLSSFDTANVTDMSGMFQKCSALPALDVSSFRTSKVTDMRRMFSGCTLLASLDVTNFDVSSVTASDDFMEPGRMINGKVWQEYFR